LIGSNVGINAKWISTLANKIADEISRIKKSAHNPSSFQYDFSKLQQDHVELKHCRFFQPSQELLSMIWDILLTQKGVSKNLFPIPAEMNPDMKGLLLVSLKI